MFFWNGKGNEGTILADELLSCVDVERVLIATAFFSSDGLDILRQIKTKYRLKKDAITLYLGSSFSMKNPHELLNELDAICETRIVFDRTFHPKVYFLQGSECKLIYGSANFTGGGMERNIEFASITKPDGKQLETLRRFFAFCRTKSTPTNAGIIDFYKENTAIMEKVNREQRKLSRKLSGYLSQDDPDFSDYDLSECFFQYEDYETFFERNSTLNDSEIRERRKAVQVKMLAIHNAIYPQIKKLGIQCHKRVQNITSTIDLSVYNHHIVAWNGVRYGKTPEEIDALNYAGEKDELFQFQKHGCIQYCVTGYGFEVNLFLAVKNDAVDRYHVHEHLRKLRPNIEKEIAKLTGYGLQWVVYDPDNDNPTFDFDTRDPSEFCDYFKEYDHEGCESSLLLYYEPNDKRISSFESICAEVIRRVKQLLPLYNAMVFRPKV